MSFISNLFGGGKKQPLPVPPAPRIGDAAGEAAAREQRARQRAKYGVDQTFLATGKPLGVADAGVGRQAVAPAQSRTMLG